ncbi:MAG: T9SS type A sorting domain-containing protein, partial [Ignavibacteria bacterium]
DIFAGLGEGGVYKSTNGGYNWVSTALNYHIIYSLATLGDYLFAGSNTAQPIYWGLVHISTNHGANWSGSGLANQDVYSLATFGNILYAGADQGVYVSSNNGNTFTKTLNVGTISLAAFENKVFAGTSNNGIFYSSNYGANWIWTSMNYNRVLSLAINGNYVFAGTLDSGLYISSNNGGVWVKSNQGFNLNPTVSSLLIINNLMYAGTWNNFIWRRPLSELTGIQNISTETPSKYLLGQNYPNPFNPTTNIKYSIVNSGDVKLVVYDIQGREVQTLVSESLKPGTYEASFDGSKLNSGVYFYKLITGTFSETKKMLLIK